MRKGCICSLFKIIKEEACRHQLRAILFQAISLKVCSLKLSGKLFVGKLCRKIPVRIPGDRNCTIACNYRFYSFVILKRYRKQKLTRSSPVQLLAKIFCHFCSRPGGCPEAGSSYINKGKACPPLCDTHCCKIVCPTAVQIFCFYGSTRSNDFYNLAFSNALTALRNFSNLFTDYDFLSKTK